ncbi:DUF4886 domain-containing protein [Ruficoccus sp. ZRK36]|uniref:DUF4886 domain-containing protein n=1 Tax=Ruficoccus sp. ZRK36 TaxID=2866311 RepID=UPI001C7385CA|nr:DUF4886 domain-containing protein [Ruficoccus sp. ZRK36]QYY36925.1 DUF4886 domain-containing protein [Ruficoccus sp. ZRK36]
MLKITLFVPLLLLFATALRAETETIKVLGIGNSFTNNAHHFLSKVCESVDGVNAEIGTAFIGGCSLDRHMRHAQEHEADPETGNEYVFRLNWKYMGSHKSLKEILQYTDWDVISIQQVSTKSYKEETFYPYAKQLIDYVRQYCPDAEIVVHETWSHSVNSPRTKRMIDSDAMYEKLHANYAKIAAENGLRVIPVGTAFQNARATEMWDLKPNDFDPENHGLVYPQDKDNLPDMSKSLNKDYMWRETDDGWVVKTDGYHANTAGEYLGALVWFQFLTGVDARKVTYQPDGLSDEQAASLRQIAYETVEAIQPAGCCSAAAKAK